MGHESIVMEDHLQSTHLQEGSMARILVRCNSVVAYAPHRQCLFV